MSSSPRQYVITGPGTGEIQPQDPPEPGPGQLRMKMAASLISPGTELIIRQVGKVGRVPGYTGVGVIDRAGPGADPSWVGQTCFLMPHTLPQQTGCHASFRLIDHDELLIPLDGRGISPTQAVYLRLVNIAMTPFAAIPIRIRGPVAVIGLGLVGQMIAQVASAWAHDVIGIEPDAARRQRTRRWGSITLVDPTAEPAVDRVKQATDGAGAQLTINATGRADLFPDAIRMTATGGEVSTLGGVRGEAGVDLSTFLEELHTRHLTARGGWELKLPFRSAPALQTPSAEDHLRLALRWLGDRTVVLDGIHTHVIPPEQINEAYAALASQDPEYLGVVVAWDEAAG